MAKIFEMHSFGRRNSKQASSNYELKSPDFIQRGGEKFLLIKTAKGVSGSSWPGWSWRTALSAGTKLLPLIAVLWGLYLTGIGRKSGDANAKQDDLVKARAVPQPSQSGQATAKPSPIIPVDRTPVEGSILPEQPPYAVAHSPVPRNPAMRYEATRKKMFGGCTGQLELSNSRLQFRCPDQADLTFPVAAIAKVHKDGVVLKSGERYHFIIANYTRSQVETIFVSWLNRVRLIPQPSRVSSF